MITNAVVGSDATLNLWSSASHAGIVARIWIEDESIILTSEVWNQGEMINREVKKSWPIRDFHTALSAYYELASLLNP